MSRKLCCVAATLMCLVTELAGAKTNIQIRDDARNKGMLTVNDVLTLLCGFVQATSFSSFCLHYLRKQECLEMFAKSTKLSRKTTGSQITAHFN